MIFHLLGVGASGILRYSPVTAFLAGARRALGLGFGGSAPFALALGILAHRSAKEGLAGMARVRVGGDSPGGPAYFNLGSRFEVATAGTMDSTGGLGNNRSPRFGEPGPPGQARRPLALEPEASSL